MTQAIKINSFYKYFKLIIFVTTVILSVIYGYTHQLDGDVVQLFQRMNHFLSTGHLIPYGRLQVVGPAETCQEAF